MNKLFISIVATTAIFLTIIGIYFFLKKATWFKYIDNAKELKNSIIVESPRPNEVVKSPLTITGRARGNWFFEGQFRIQIIRNKYEGDYDDSEIGYGVAKAKSNWITEDFVPFEATIEFAKPINPTGTIILNKENPSGLKEKGDEPLFVPIKF